MLNVKEIQDYTKSTIRSFEYYIHNISTCPCSKEHYDEIAEDMFDEVFTTQQDILEFRMHNSVPKPVEDCFKSIEKAMNRAISFFRDYKIIKFL